MKCLKDKLLAERDLLQRLVGTLKKFEKGAIAITNDSEQMFFQVKVKKNNHCLTISYPEIKTKSEKVVIYT